MKKRDIVILLIIIVLAIVSGAVCGKAILDRII